VCVGRNRRICSAASFFAFSVGKLPGLRAGGGAVPGGSVGRGREPPGHPRRHRLGEQRAGVGVHALAPDHQPGGRGGDQCHDDDARDDRLAIGLEVLAGAEDGVGDLVFLQAVAFGTFHAAWQRYAGTGGGRRWWM
jgi:hypothetical protein